MVMRKNVIKVGPSSQGTTTASRQSMSSNSRASNQIQINFEESSNDSVQDLKTEQPNNLLELPTIEKPGKKKGRSNSFHV